MNDRQLLNWLLFTCRRCHLLQLAAQAAADPGSLKRLAQQVIADEPYPDELILIGAVLQHHEVGSMEALLEKLHQDSAKAIKVVKSTRTEVRRR